MQETWVRSLDQEDPWRRAWQPTPVFMPGKSPWTEEPGRLQFMGSQRVGHNWATKRSTHREASNFKFSLTDTLNYLPHFPPLLNPVSPQPWLNLANLFSLIISLGCLRKSNKILADSCLKTLVLHFIYELFPFPFPKAVLPFLHSSQVTQCSLQTFILFLALHLYVEISEKQLEMWPKPQEKCWY